MIAPTNFGFLEEYREAGFQFVEIPRVQGKPTKGPRGVGWNLPRSPANSHGYTADPAEARQWLRDGKNLGLALVPSHVVSLDVDHLTETLRVLADLGLDPDGWFSRPDRVEILSGKPGKAKLLFRLPADLETPPPSKKLTFGKGKTQTSIFEIRHGSIDGQTLQDLLPPSIHPDTLQPYQLVGDVRQMPVLPADLAALWRSWPLETLKTFDSDFDPPKPKARPKSTVPTLDGERDPIAEFNQAHDLETLLESHGYRRRGRRYLRPGSESGVPGLALLEREDGRRVCFSHGGDDLNDGYAHDAFDVYRILNCGGDWKIAFTWNPEITAHNRRVFIEKKRTEAESGALRQPNETNSSRPVILIIGGTLHLQVEAAEIALITNGTEIYQRGGEIVRPIRLGLVDENGITIPAGAMVLGPADKHWTAKAMTRAAQFEKYNSRTEGWVITDCPMKLAEAYLSSAGEWKIPVIVGISECPTLRNNGSLILKSGHDRKSGIFVDYHGPEVSVLKNPTKQDALTALEFLKKPFSEFPFIDDASYSVALSGVLTATVRRSLRTAPMHAFDAPTKGSGKSLLADITAIIATGRSTAMISQGRDEAEDEKKLSSMLMRSAPIICIDNRVASNAKPLIINRFCNSISPRKAKKSNPRSGPDGF